MCDVLVRARIYVVVHVPPPRARVARKPENVRQLGVVFLGGDILKYNILNVNRSEVKPDFNTKRPMANLKA